MINMFKQELSYFGQGIDEPGSGIPLAVIFPGTDPKALAAAKDEIGSSALLINVKNICDMKYLLELRNAKHWIDIADLPNYFIIDGFCDIKRMGSGLWRPRKGQSKAPQNNKGKYVSVNPHVLCPNIAATYGQTTEWGWNLLVQKQTAPAREYISSGREIS